MFLTLWAYFHTVVRHEILLGPDYERTDGGRVQSQDTAAGSIGSPVCECTDTHHQPFLSYSKVVSVYTCLVIKTEVSGRFDFD